MFAYWGNCRIPLQFRPNNSILVLICIRDSSRAPAHVRRPVRALWPPLRTAAWWMRASWCVPAARLSIPPAITGSWWTTSKSVWTKLFLCCLRFWMSISISVLFCAQSQNSFELALVCCCGFALIANRSTLCWLGALTRRDNDSWVLTLLKLDEYLRRAWVS